MAGPDPTFAVREIDKLLVRPDHAHLGTIRAMSEWRCAPNAVAIGISADVADHFKTDRHVKILVYG